jgi:hypothetical protein
MVTDVFWVDFWLMSGGAAGCEKVRILSGAVFLFVPCSGLLLLFT